MIVDHLTWETGAEPGMPPTGEGNAPISEAVNTTSPLSGFADYKITFGSNDNWSWADNDQVYDRSAITDEIGFQIRFKIDTVADHDHFAWYVIFNSNSPDTFYLGIVVEEDGSIRAVSGDQSGSSFNSEGTVAQSSSGLVADDTEHVISAWFDLDNSSGRAVVALDNSTVIDFTGDTQLGNFFGTEQTAWGRGAYISTASSLSGSGEVWLDDIHYHAEESGVLVPRRYVGLVPDGVTAENDGTVFGGASDAADATDERPATDADGFTLDAVNDRQGLTFASLPGGEGTIQTVCLEGAVGDDAAGSETFTAELDDGTNQAVGPTLGAGASFANRKLTDIEALDPSGGAWTDTTVNALEAVIDRTA